MTTATRTAHCAHSGHAVCGACAPPDRDPVRLSEVLADLLPLPGAPGRPVTGVPGARGPVAGDPGNPGAPAPALPPEAHDPTVGRPMTCVSCAGPAFWHRTVNDRWVPLEPGLHATAAIPPGHRWRVDAAGVAHHLGRSSPTDLCRVTHFEVCPARPARTAAPALLALRHRHALRVAADPGTAL